MTTGNSTYNLTFVYDRYGNMSCQTNGQTHGLCTNVSFNSANNQISTAGYAYDAAGNLTQDPTWMPTATYTWDAEGRVTKITQGSNTCSNNVFNAQGQEVEEVYPIFGNDTNEMVFDRSPQKVQRKQALVSPILQRMPPRVPVRRRRMHRA